MTAQTTKPAVAIIGLGNMGSALADVLIAKGFPVTVWNRTPAKATRFAAAGARVAGSVADAARTTDVVIACVLDHATTMAAVATDEAGAALEGKILVQLTTMTADESRILATWAAGRGIRYLEGQIQDYPVDVRTGHATILCAGPKDIHGACQDVLHGMAARAPLVAEAFGAAATIDKALFAFAWPATVGLIHAAAMCEAAGVPVATLLDTVILPYVKTGPFADELDRYARTAVSGAFDENVQATLDVYREALGKTLRVSQAAGLAIDHLKPIDDLFARAIALGHGHHDLPSVIEAIRKPV